MINVVLFEPEIPQNAGNIARLCACTGARLFFVGRLGFSLSDKYLKRSGMDYWDKVEWKHYNTFEELVSENLGEYYFFTTKAKKLYTEVKFCENVFLVFGPESRGLPESILGQNSEQCAKIQSEHSGEKNFPRLQRAMYINGEAIRIPMKENTRSLNLSNSVAVAVYEVVRQLGGVF